jgi:hypothetical protein
MSLLWLVYYVEYFYDDGKDIQFQINKKNQIDNDEDGKIESIDPFLIDDGENRGSIDEAELADFLRYL